MEELNPTLFPSSVKLWVKIAEELPRVMLRSFARCSRSSSSFFRQSVKDKIEIQLANNADVKSGHSSLSLGSAQSNFTTRVRFLGLS